MQRTEPFTGPATAEGPHAQVSSPKAAGTSGSAPPPAARAVPAASSTPRATAARSAAFLPYRGSLSIDSDPEGAQVSVNGRVVGSTPVVLENVPAGSCVVRIEADGYEPWSTAARVVAHRKNRVSATLQRASQDRP